MAAHWRTAVRQCWDRCVLFSQFCCGVHVFTTHVGQIHQVLGPSMLPTFSVNEDVLVVERLSTKFHGVKPGDVVMALSPENPRTLVCKRILAVEGDSVASLLPNSGGLVQHIIIPKGHVWLQGDNALNSTDSRHYGPVPYALLQGKVCLRIWPPGGWSSF